jgi:hypothetical protein
VTIDLDDGRQEDIEADIAVFENVSLARARFFDDIVANRNKNSRIGARELRQDTVYQLAEFYYLLEVFDIDGADGLTRLGMAHNKKIEELCESEDLHDKLGIQPQRLHDAMFDSDEKFARLQANCGANGVRLSQSDLARFVIEYMSPETCRNVVKVLAESGYLHLSARCSFPPAVSSRNITASTSDRSDARWPRCRTTPRQRVGTEEARCCIAWSVVWRSWALRFHTAFCTQP